MVRDSRQTVAQQLLGFGESVLFRFPGKGPHHAPDGNIGALGGDGIFLAYSRNSNTFMVSTSEGVVAVRSTTRRPERERWSHEGLAKIRSVPGEARRRPARAQEESFVEPATDRAPTTEEPRPPALRQLRINMSDLR